jgi:hypothetical protein
MKDLSFVLKDGPIAQFWLERTPDKREVGGSSPPRPTKTTVKSVELKVKRWTA